MRAYLCRHDPLGVCVLELGLEAFDLLHLPLHLVVCFDLSTGRVRKFRVELIDAHLGKEGLVTGTQRLLIILAVLEPTNIMIPFRNIRVNKSLR